MAGDGLSCHLLSMDDHQGGDGVLAPRFAFIFVGMSAAHSPLFIPFRGSDQPEFFASTLGATEKMDDIVVQATMVRT